MHTKRILGLAAALAVCATLSACGSPAESESEPVPEPTPDTEPALSTVSDPTPYYELGLSLLRNIDAEGGSVLVSPISLARPLAVIAEGAEGSTLSQIYGVLGVTADGTLDTDLEALAASWSGEDDTFSIADSLWVNETFEPSDEFIAASKEEFGAEVFDRAFDDATLAEINGWVDENTHGMIDEILEKIDPSYALYVIDACAFEGKWEVPYGEGAVEEATFTAEDGSTSQVSMMWDEDYSGYLEDDLCTGFIKPYAGGKFAFIGLLPEEGATVEDLVGTIHGQQLAELVRMGSQGSARTGLPKFDGAYTMDLAGALKAMGMTDAFDQSKADFSGMLADPSQPSPWIGEVVQKTFVEVNEEGTKAAAATEVGFEVTSLAPESAHEVVLDRPFVYLIVDAEANVPLFMGTVGSIS